MIVMNRMYIIAQNCVQAHIHNNGGDNMATKSILKSVTLKDNKSCQKLLSVLEKTAVVPRRDIVISKTHETISDPETIRKMFKK